MLSAFRSLCVVFTCIALPFHHLHRILSTARSHKRWGWTTYGLMALIGWLLMQLCTSANRRRQGTPTTGTANPYATGSGYGGGGSGGGGKSRLDHFSLML